MKVELVNSRYYGSVGIYLGNGLIQRSVLTLVLYQALEGVIQKNNVKGKDCYRGRNYQSLVVEEVATGSV